MGIVLVLSSTEVPVYWTMSEPYQYPASEGPNGFLSLREMLHRPSQHYFCCPHAERRSTDVHISLREMLYGPSQHPACTPQRLTAFCRNFGGQSGCSFAQFGDTGSIQLLRFVRRCRVG